MKVAFNNLTLPTQQIREQYLTAVAKILDQSHFILSEEVGQFEQQWAKAIGTSHAVGVSNGGDALYLSLLAAGIKSGDEVITQGNAYNASVTAILRVGAVPRFADIDPNTLTINTEKLATLINPRTKAILPVHLYGMANNMAEIMDLANKNNLLVIEDCAQAHFAEFNGKKVGSFGLAGGFSFYPTKNLGAFGDAGAVTTNNPDIYKKLLMLRNLGQAEKNNHQLLGFNMRLDPLQAVVLSLKLEHLAGLTQMRIEAAEYYNKLIEEKNLQIKPQQLLPNAKHVYHLYTIIVENISRDVLKTELLKKDVETGVYYPIPVYKQPFFKSATVDNCPVTDEVCNKILCLPLYPGIEKRQQEYVIESISEVIKTHAQ